MNNGENKNMRPSRNFFLFYCIILFLFAAILITLSYLSQERIERELENKTDSLKEKNDIIAEYEDTIINQRSQIDTLTTQVSDSTAMLLTQEKQIAASEYLWKLVKAEKDGNLGECISIIGMIDSDGLREHLTPEGLAELERIEKITKGA